MGDPAGIGPEVIYKTLIRRDIYKFCQPVVIGSIGLAKKLGFDFRKLPCRLCDIAGDAASGVRAGKESATSGEASYRYIIKAVELVKSGGADCIATAPISKAALQAAGHDFAGHTELLAALTGTGNFAMLMSSGKMNVVMATRHLPVAEVSRALTAVNIFKTAALASDFLKRAWKLRSPRIAVLALNPHAGEAGHIGTEELKIINPAVKKLVLKGYKAAGPLPADSGWQKMNDGKYDLLVAMYHDQAMIGFKIISPESLVNVTLGLPFLRTSPGHGTAFDIAGKNLADPAPMKESIIFAAKYC